MMSADATQIRQTSATRKSKLQILVVTRNLPPLIGGMERLLVNLTLGLADDCDLTVIGPKGCREFLPADIVVKEASANVLPFLVAGTAMAINVCRKQHFDLVVGGSGIAAAVLATITRIFKVPSLVLLHGLDIVFDHPLYQGVFLPCIRRVNHAIVNSENTRQLAIQAGLKTDNLTVVNPGTELPPLPDSEQVAAFKHTFNVPFSRFILFVGRITPRKGLSVFIKVCLPKIIENHPDIGLVIVGDSPTNSLNKQSELSEVVSEISVANLKQHVAFLGHIDDSDLENCFAAAELQILPLIETAGDVEGFGMVAVEAAACGTPTVAFRLGGVADAISSDSGALIAPGDYSAMSDAVGTLLNGGYPNADSCRKHAERFAWPQYHAQVRSVVTALVNSAQRSAN